MIFKWCRDQPLFSLLKTKDMNIEKMSILDGKTYKMDLDVTWDQIKEHRNGKHAQNAFPTLTPEEREFMISGITPEEWKKVFGNGD